MKIGLFGGTFNPLHKGHMNLVKKIHSKLNLDEIWIIPSFRTPNKSFFPERVEPIHRYKIIKKVLSSEKIKWLKLSDYELNQKRVSYTIDTVDYFKKLYPKDELYLLMGDDTYKQIESWRKYQSIIDKVNLVVYKREGLSLEEREKYKITYIDDIVYDISSTKVLSNLNWDDIPKTARVYIAKHKLYLKAVVFYKLYNSEKFEHSLSVASHAKRLAKKNKIKKYERAYYAGLFHDVFKLETKANLIRFITKNSNWQLPHYKVMHGYAAAIWLDTFYQINDKDIVNSIKKHTVPDDKMSTFDKIIYVADKISDDRNNKDVAHLKKMAYLNLEETFKKLLIIQRKILEEKNIKIEGDFKKAYTKYVLEKKIKKEKRRNRIKNELFKRLN